MRIQIKTQAGALKVYFVNATSPVIGTRPVLRIRVGMGSFGALLIYAVLLIFSSIFLLPLMYMISVSLQTLTEVYQSSPVLLPAVPQWVNYAKTLQDPIFYRAGINSILLVTTVLLGTVTSVSLVAFSFSRLKWPGRSVVFGLMMSTMLLPYQITMVPQYVMFSQMGWVGTFNPLTIPAFFAGGAALVFLMRQFMLRLPKELDEAAMMDGASPLQIWWYVIMPLCRPALATISLFLFVGQWNSLVQPVVYLQNNELYPLSVYVALKQTGSPVPWQEMMASSVLFVIPMLVVFMLTQRYFIQSIILTG